MNKRGLGRVFAFTFRRQTETTGYRALTAVVAALCLLVPILVLGIMGARHDGGTQEDYLPPDEWALPACNAVSILAHDETENPITDWSFLRDLHPESWGEMVYVNDEGSDADHVDGRAIYLSLKRGESGCEAHVWLPEGSALTQEDLSAYETFLWENFPAILEKKAGLTARQLSALSAPITLTPRPTQDDEGVQEVLGMLLPYLGVMIMYFLVLFYGQGVANSVILEKSNKLMDFFLVSVDPVAMVLGKVLAMAAAGLLQVCLWGASLWGGFAAGAAICRALAPQAQLGILAFFDSLSLLQGMFSLPAVLLSVGIVLGGFLIYCALSGVGGALASRPEELGSTNVMFTMALVASFLVCLLGGSGDGVIAADAWMNYVPFTAILVTPARLLLGEASLITGALSLLIVLVTAVVLCVLAGRVYAMMSLYRGKAPSLGLLVRMLRNQ